jgi:hypothetical protein
MGRESIHHKRPNTRLPRDWLGGWPLGLGEKNKNSARKIIAYRRSHSEINEK